MEGEAMKKNWLRGVLLGVSLALLLGGGAVLANGMTATVNWDCFPCWPGDWGPEAEGLPSAEYILQLSVAGLNPMLPLCSEGYFPGVGWTGECMGEPVGTTSYRWYMIASCEEDEFCIWVGELEDEPVICFDGVEYGELRFKVWQEDDAVVVNGPVWRSAIFAEVCEVEEEFVPEPGSMLLLGSGLMGLAGYATLRWRARQ
jgi:hypothetical protein